jgi:hypothetical protein
MFSLRRPGSRNSRLFEQMVAGAKETFNQLYPSTCHEKRHSLMDAGVMVEMPRSL